MTTTCTPPHDADDAGDDPGRAASRRSRRARRYSYGTFELALDDSLRTCPEPAKLSARQLDDATFVLPDAQTVMTHRQRTRTAQRRLARPSTAESLNCAARMEFEQTYGFLSADLVSAPRTDGDVADATSAPAGWVPPGAPVPPQVWLEQLVGAVPCEESGTAVMSHLIAVEKLRSWLTATSHVLLARLAEPGIAGDPDRMVWQLLREAPSSLQPGSDDFDYDAYRTERDNLTTGVALDLAATQVAAVRHLASSTAGSRVGEALDVVHGLPLTMRALFDGEIDSHRAQVLAERTSRCTDEQRLQLEAELLPLAADRTPRQWRLLVDAAVIAIDPIEAERRRRTALTHRRIEHESLPDGMGKILAVLPAEQAQLAWDLFQMVGAQLAEDGDERTSSQRRADILATIIERLAAGESVSITGLLAEPGATRHDACCRNTTPTDTPSDTAPAATVADGEGEGRHRGVEDDDGRAGVASEHVDAADAGAADAASGAGAVDDADAGANGADVDEAADDADVGAANGAVDAAAAADVDEAADGADVGGQNDFTGQGDLAGDGDTAGSIWRLPTRHGRRTHLTVTMTLDALAGLSAAPGMLAGHGVITAEHARALAETATSVNLLITDNNGHGKGASNHISLRQRQRYRPGQATRDQVTTLRPTCVFTGCHQRAVRADLDHREPFNHHDPDVGGSTDPANLYPLCRRHHRLRTFGGWSYRPGEAGTGTLVFTSPLGIESTTVLDGTLLPAGLRPPDPPEDPPPF